MRPIINTRSVEERYDPLPQVLGKGWEIEEGPGHAVPRGRGQGGVISVPRGPDDFDRVRRMRAIVAGKHSPQQWRNVPERVTPELLLVAETMRVGALTRHGLDVLRSDLSQKLSSHDEIGLEKDFHNILGASQVMHSLIGPYINGDITALITTMAREVGIFETNRVLYELLIQMDLEPMFLLARHYTYEMKVLANFGPVFVYEKDLQGNDYMTMPRTCESCSEAWKAAEALGESTRAIYNPQFHVMHTLMDMTEESGSVLTKEHVTDFFRDPARYQAEAEYSQRAGRVLSFVSQIGYTLRQSVFLGRAVDGLDANEHRTSIRIAEILSELLEDEERALQRYDDTFDEGQSECDDPGPSVRSLRDGEGEGDDGDASEAPLGFGKSETEDEYNRDLDRSLSEGMPYAADSYEDEWGEMTIVNFQRDRLIPSRLTAPARRYSDRGVVPSAIHRWCSDKQVFTTKRRAAGGSVLIDVSGSMDLDNEEVHEILETIPAGIIGIYSSSSGHGTLRIVAKDGRMVDRHVLFDWGPREDRSKTMRNYGGGNGVDGPALEWLGKQEFPRIWISDGIVTGASESFVQNLYDDSRRLQRKHKILRVEEVNEALEKLGKYAS